MFKNPFIKSKNIANQKRYFDRTYYIKTSNNSNSSMTNYNSFAKEGYLNNPIVYKAINLISRTGSSVDFLFYTKDKDGNKIELINHSINKLFRNPNPIMSNYSFIESILSYFMMSGNIFIQAVKNELNELKEMYILRPDRVKVIPGINLIPNGYQYILNNTTIQEFLTDENGFCDILHIKNFNPMDDFYGVSPVESAKFSIEQHNECVKWNKALLENGARPTGALVIKENLTDAQFEQVKNQLDNQIKSFDNAGKIMVLEGGIEWKEMSINPKDMDFIETKNSSARDIAMYFGIPSQLLGIKGDNTYSNMLEARLSFWEDTMIPLLNNICTNLSKWFSFLYEEEIVVEIDKDSISALVEKRQSIWNNLSTIPFLSDDEKREILGFNEILNKKTL